MCQEPKRRKLRVTSSVECGNGVVDKWVVTSADGWCCTPYVKEKSYPQPPHTHGYVAPLTPECVLILDHRISEVTDSLLTPCTSRVCATLRRSLVEPKTLENFLRSEVSNSRRLSPVTRGRERDPLKEYPNHSSTLTGSFSGISLNGELSSVIIDFHCNI